jgi:hypothetical protein
MEAYECWVQGLRNVAWRLRQILWMGMYFGLSACGSKAGQTLISRRWDVDPVRRHVIYHTIFIAVQEFIILVAHGIVNALCVRACRFVYLIQWAGLYLVWNGIFFFFFPPFLSFFLSPYSCFVREAGCNVACIFDTVTVTEKIVTVSHIELSVDWFPLSCLSWYCELVAAGDELVTANGNQFTVVIRISV